MNSKFLLVISFILLFLGVGAIGGSIYFAVNNYFIDGGILGGGPKSKTQKIDEKLDSDGDGIPDKIEIEVYGTDPFKWDTDGDGYSDKQEIDAGYDPLTPAN
jgi:hypothetical protein